MAETDDQHPALAVEISQAPGVRLPDRVSSALARLQEVLEDDDDVGGFTMNSLKMGTGMLDIGISKDFGRIGMSGPMVRCESEYTQSETGTGSCKTTFTWP